jgi:predicted transcriptional regulator
VNKSTKSTRSRSAIRTVLSRLKKQGTVKQDRRSGEYRPARRVRAVPGRESTARRKGLVKEPPRAELG